MPNSNSLKNSCSYFLDVIILAAGKGTRMPSLRPKALQTLLGDAMISHVYQAVLKISQNSTSVPPDTDSTKNKSISFPAYCVNTIWTVVGHEADTLKKYLYNEHGQNAVDNCVFQDQQLGTGHAVLCVLNALKDRLQNQIITSDSLQKPKKILVLNADTPLITTSILQDFIQKAQNTPLAFMSLVLDEPASYGRVLRADFSHNIDILLQSEKTSTLPPLKNTSAMLQLNTGPVSRIVEAKDFKKEFNQEKTGAEIYEVNAGIYLFDITLLEDLLPQISTENLSAEYYLTDIVSLAHKKGYDVEAICADEKIEQKSPLFSQNNFNIHQRKKDTRTDMCTALLGVNTPYELAHAESLLQRKEIEHRIRTGVIIHAPEMVRISPFAIIEKGVEIFGPCEIYGKSFIGKNTRIESHVYIENTNISEDCHVRSFCHFVDASIGARTSIGPYARLRPEAKLAEEVHVGNFVEIKKSTISSGSKINHLSYIGDSEVGSGVNVGAGCITCNYDGVHKHKTIIEDKAFLGSNCAFVAPVKIGKNTLIGAGSVITKDVADNTLAVARSHQITLKKSNQN